MKFKIKLIVMESKMVAQVELNQTRRWEILSTKSQAKRRIKIISKLIWLKMRGVAWKMQAKTQQKSKLEHLALKTNNEKKNNFKDSIGKIQQQNDIYRLISNAN